MATLFFAALNTLVKFMPHLPVSELVFFRALISLSLCYVALRLKGLSVVGKNIKILVLRGFFGTVSLFTLFYCLQHMPMAMAITLSQMSPLFSVLIAHFILNEKAHWTQAVLLLIAFSGVVLVKGWSGELSWFLTFMGVITAFVSACAYTCVRGLKDTDDPLVVVFYFPLMTIPLMAWPTYREWVQPTTLDWILILFLGIFTQLAQYFMTLAYQMERASSVMIYNYMGVLWALLIGYFLFHESLNNWQLMGVLVIVACLIASTRISKKLSERKSLV
ncbi:MAG: DMT family transporter [Bdellovibrionales bacterium]|nr:DMT family transporter [Bdellovibrionales bacterium]